MPLSGEEVSVTGGTGRDCQTRNNRLPWGQSQASHSRPLAGPREQREHTPICSVTEEQQRAKVTVSSDVICSWAWADLRKCSPTSGPRAPCGQQAVLGLPSHLWEGLAPRQGPARAVGQVGVASPGPPPDVSFFLLLSFRLTATTGHLPRLSQSELQSWPSCPWPTAPPGPTGMSNTRGLTECLLSTPSLHFLLPSLAQLSKCHLNHLLTPSLVC